MLQRFVGDICPIQIQILEVDEACEVFDPIVAHLGPLQMQQSQRREIFQMHQPRAGNLGVSQIQRNNVVQRGNVRESLVRQLPALKMKLDFPLIAVIFQRTHGTTEFLDGGKGICRLASLQA